jgi:uncharacterized protein YbjT (DUF2867 family)
MMKVIVFGATGMLGQGTMLECIADASVTQVLAVGRGPSGFKDAKVRDLVVKDLTDYSGVASELAGFDACFFCLGISSAGMKEPEYTRITYDIAIAAAKALVAANPQLTFCYISGAGTDSSENGSSMWARVKGKTENALLKMGFKAAYMFRPGLIRPLKGIKSRTTSYRILYAAMTPFYGLMGMLAGDSMTDTVRVGRAMINVAAKGYSKPILDPKDINTLAA